MHGVGVAESAGRGGRLDRTPPHLPQTLLYGILSLNLEGPSRTKFILHEIAMTLRSHPLQPPYMAGVGLGAIPVLSA